MDPNKCQNFTRYRESETFHLGSDGIIHFTETHQKRKYHAFCVDLESNEDLGVDGKGVDEYYYEGQHIEEESAFLADITSTP